MAPVTQLVPAGAPGEFVNPAWVPGTPGTFAVVVGVSSYPHLAGGPAEAGDTYGLGQLYVSAATAYRFFDWLRTRYDVAAAPLARCWLLLAPTAAELGSFGVATAAELNAAAPTIDGCAAALGTWSAAMAALPRVAAEASRGMFFFSGHGLEIWQEEQILLPSDYLRPPVANVNDAVSTQNLRRGLSASPVPGQYMFIDACRNDARRLRELNVTGRKILNEPLAFQTNPDVLFGILYAAASGTETWQPRELEKGFSVFGGSVIDGLRGDRGLERRGCDTDRCEVQFYPLETFVKARMADVLKSFQSQEKVRVRNGGTPPDGFITAVPVRPAAVGGGVVASATPVLDARYDVHHDKVAWPVTGDWGTGHAIFGSERMTNIWTGARAVDLDTGAPVPRPEIVVVAVSHSTLPLQASGAFRVTIRLPYSRRGHWLQFEDAIGQSFACVLPGGAGRYELEIDLDHMNPADVYEPSSVARVAAGLSPSAQGVVGTVAAIWQTYQTHNAATAAEQIHLDILGDAVEGKVDSPLAATVAATVLLRVRRLDLLRRDWLRNLSNWFPELADPPVLWAEQLRLQHDPVTGFDAGERLMHLERLVQRGLPMLSEVLPVAGRQLAELDGAAGPELASLRRRIDTAMRYFRPGGMFAVFSAASAGALTPDLVR